MAHSKPWSLISPASRGIGHALTRHLLRTTRAPVVATVRDHTRLEHVRSTFLHGLGVEDAEERLHVYRADVKGKGNVSGAFDRHTRYAISFRTRLRWLRCS